MHVLAIDIGGTKLSAGVFRDKVLIERGTCPTNREGGPGSMLDQIERITKEWIDEFGIQACGIGFGGPVDFQSQRVICSTHVEGWDNFDLVSAIRERLGIQVILDRDTMLGALGEGHYGAGRGVRPLFYMTISTGIGGGLLMDHGLYRGADSFACEIGHHTIDPGGPACLCGARGCLERLCSGLWIERDYGQPASELLKDPGFASNYVRPLAQGLKTCIMLFNPARIIIGGGISKAGALLFVPLREELGRQLTPWSRASVDVVPAQLGDDAILWGALALVQRRL